MSAVCKIETYWELWHQIKFQSYLYLIDTCSSGRLGLILKRSTGDLAMGKLQRPLGSPLLTSALLSKFTLTARRYCTESGGDALL